MKTKVFLSAFIVLFLIVICWLSADILRLKKQLNQATATIERLAGMQAVYCSVSVEVNNKATFGSIKAGDVEVVADQILKYTRGQLLQNDTLCKNISQ